jgi:hypothetical protein
LNIAKKRARKFKFLYARFDETKNRARIKFLEPRFCLQKRKRQTNRLNSGGLRIKEVRRLKEAETAAWLKIYKKFEIAARRDSSKA